MAAKKQQPSDEGIYVSKPKPDIYLALIILTTLAMVAATGIMCFESALK